MTTELNLETLYDLLMTKVIKNTLIRDFKNKVFCWQLIKEVAVWRFKTFSLLRINLYRWQTTQTISFVNIFVGLTLSPFTITVSYKSTTLKKYNLFRFFLNNQIVCQRIKDPSLVKMTSDGKSPKPQALIFNDETIVLVYKSSLLLWDRTNIKKPPHLYSLDSYIDSAMASPLLQPQERFCYIRYL